MKIPRFVRLSRSAIRLSIAACLLSVACELLFCQRQKDDNRILLWENSAEIAIKAGQRVLFAKSPDRFRGWDESKEESFTAATRLAKNQAPYSLDRDLFQSVPGPYGGTVRSIAVDQGGWLFIATDGGVYRSSDNGSHWEGQLFPSQLFSFVEPVTVLGPNIVVAETDYSNFISTNRGESWNYLLEDARGFVVDSLGTIYAGSNSGGVKKSTDTARSWTSLGLQGKKIFNVALCGSAGLVCSSDSGLFLSSDNGSSWTLKSYAGQFYGRILGDRRGHLFLLQGVQVQRSDDFGNTWRDISPPNSNGDVYRIYFQMDKGLFVVASAGIFNSTDLGETWTSLSTPFFPLTVGVDTHGDLLAGCFYGVYRLDRTNGKWTQVSVGIHARRIEMIQSTTAGSLLALSLGECFRSSDNGSNWSRVDMGSGVYVAYYVPILSCSFGSEFLAAGFDGQSGLLRSTNDGVSWQKIPILLNYYAIRGIAEGPSRSVLVGTYFGDIYRSTDGGDSWGKVLSSPSQSEIRCFASDSSGHFYAAKDTSILLSDDGTTWKEVPLRRNYSSWESMTIDKGGKVYLGSSSNGVYRSRDQGASWRIMNEGLFATYVMSSAADDRGNVFLGTSWGVFRLADSVDSWQSYTSGLPHTYVTSLTTSREGLVFAGTQSHGMYRTTAPIGARVRPPADLPDFDLSLLQNYPNPFNGKTAFRYGLSLEAKVEIRVFDILGRLVTTLVTADLLAGNYVAEWSPGAVSSGVYFCEMTARGYSRILRRTVKLLYLR